MMTDNMNIMTALSSTIRKIESVEILTILPIHWCICNINSYKIMFLAPYSMTKLFEFREEWSAWICVRFFTSCGNRIIKFEFSRIVC